MRVKESWSEASATTSIQVKTLSRHCNSMTPPTVTLEVIRERERVCNDSEGPIETQSHKGEREREKRAVVKGMKWKEERYGEGESSCQQLTEKPHPTRSKTQADVHALFTPFLLNKNNQSIVFGYVWKYRKNENNLNLIIFVINSPVFSHKIFNLNECNILKF